MKPLKTLLFFIGVFAGLFFLVLVFPQEGIKINKDLGLRFMTRADLFQKDTSSNSYTDSLIRYASLSEDPEFGGVDSAISEIESLFLLDSIAKRRKDSLVKVRIDSISKRVYPIQMSEEGKERLHVFFGKARSAANQGDLLRIVHYGDSQIENDRMSALIRFRLQSLFGGSGCGMVPAVPLYSGNPVFKERFEGNWKRYTGFGKRDSSLRHNAYGTLTCFTSIPIGEDEILPYLEFEFDNKKRAGKFSEMKLYLHAYRDSNELYLQINDSISDTIRYIADGYSELSYIPDVKVKTMNIAFNFREGGRIYGLSFDAFAGVQVDNAAMRGSSGLVFTKVDSTVLHDMLVENNTGLLLLQFGGNVVPYITNPSYYKRTFKRELDYLKKVFPEMAILVVGPADMATRDNGKFETFENLVPVRDALKEAALECGYSFWDMYEAMGGVKSMENFVNADPPLASTDYIHFTPKGANLMAGMLVDAIMLEYRRFEAGAGE